MSNALYPITPDMTAQQRAAVYVKRLETTAQTRTLTAEQQAKLAQYREVASRPALVTGGPGGAPTPISAAPPVSYPAAPVQPGTLGTVGGQPAVNLGSVGQFTADNQQTLIPGTWIDFRGPSGDTFGLLQQLLAVEANPDLLRGQPLAGWQMFADPAQRRSQIAQLGGSILQLGPAYYGAYSGLSGDQVAAISRAAGDQASYGLTPSLRQAIETAAATTPPGAPARAPLGAASIAAAAGNLVYDYSRAGSTGIAVSSRLPAGTVPEYLTSSPIATASAIAAATVPSASPVSAGGTPMAPFGERPTEAGPISVGDLEATESAGGTPGGTLPRGLSGPSGGVGIIDLALLGLAVIATFGLARKRKGK